MSDSFYRWETSCRYFNQKDAAEISRIYEEQQSKVLLTPDSADNTIPGQIPCGEPGLRSQGLTDDSDRGDY